MTDKEQELKAKEDASHISAKLRGETMAFALQSAVCNLGANLFEPYVSYRIQKHYAHDDPALTGNYTQNLVGEFAGDMLGAGALMLAELVFPEQLHGASRKIRSWLDPLYSSVAHQVFAKEKDSPDYEKKIEEWKTFQERNLVRSSIVASVGLAGNLATQKLLLGNPSSLKVVFAGKLASTALTTALGLTARLAFPKQMKRIDNWVGDTVFKPWLEDKTIEQDKPEQHTERLRRQEELLGMAR